MLVGSTVGMSVECYFDGHNVHKMNWGKIRQSPTGRDLGVRSVRVKLHFDVLILCNPGYTEGSGKLTRYSTIKVLVSFVSST